jgi:hypothetical protein
MSETRNEMEHRLRDSLRARADEVEATPLLWQQVGARVRRRRFVTRLSTVAATAVARAVILIVT